MSIFKTTRHFAIYLLSVSVLIAWIMMQTPGLSPTAASSAKQPAASTAQKGGGAPTGALTKEQMTARLNELDALIRDLKVQIVNNPKSATLPSQLNAATTEYNSISAYMGGDKASPVPSGTSPVQNPPRPVVVPAVPPGCTATTSTFTQSTPVAIPTGPAVVTSTIVVAGAGPFLFDVDATTFLTHTFAADLDITITSPAGTVVTLTTDNGAGNDDVFNGTVWDDDANPGGQVPYTTNNGMVTDHAYVNLTLASPLAPEEPLAAFIGEDPNGTWTITISDDLAGDGGSLNSWSLALTTLPAAPTQTSAIFTQSTPVAIPTGPAVVTSTLVVSGAGTSLFDVNVTTFLTHTFAADLDITITSPAGTVVTLTTDNGAGNDDVFNGTVWDDDANPGGQVPYTTNNGMVTDHAYVNLTLASPLTPEEALGAFIGEDPNGTWTITISDDLAGDGGSLNSWSLNINTATCADMIPPVITCPADVTAVSTGCGGTTGIVNYPPATATDNLPGVTVACVPPSGTMFPTGTTTVTCTATDTSNNTATCSFSITLFNACIQDDSNPSKVLLWDTTTGAYRFCCNGTTYTGTGSVINKSSSHSLSHIASDRRVNAVFDCATTKGEAGIQSSAGTLLCTISDRNVTNNSCSCAVAIPMAGQGSK